MSPGPVLWDLIKVLVVEFYIMVLSIQFPCTLYI